MLRLFRFLFPIMMIEGDPNAGGPPVKPDENAPGVKDATAKENEELREQLARSRADYQKISDEKKQKEEELEQSRIAKLKDQNDWQKVAQDYETKWKESDQKLSRLGKSVVLNQKMTALREAAIKGGLLEGSLEDLDKLDFPEVKVETTNTGRVQVIGTDSAIQRLKGIRPHWFGKAAPNVNGGAPRVDGPGGDDGPKVSDLLKLETEARKSGDWTKVEAFHKQYGSKLRA